MNTSDEDPERVRHLNCMAGLKKTDGGVLSVLRVPPLMIIQDINQNGEEDQRLVLKSEHEVAWLLRALKVLHQP